MLLLLWVLRDEINMQSVLVICGSYVLLKHREHLVRGHYTFAPRGKAQFGSWKSLVNTFVN